MKNINPVLKRKIHIFGLIISSKKGKLTGGGYFLEMIKITIFGLSN
ncbi:hypothetical protein V2619_03145 [Tenacibaculum maritimum]